MNPPPGSVAHGGTSMCNIPISFSMSCHAEEIARFSVYLMAACLVNDNALLSVYLTAACLVNDNALLCVLRDVTFDNGMCADSAYALLTLSGTP